MGGTEASMGADQGKETPQHQYEELRSQTMENMRKAQSGEKIDPMVIKIEGDAPGTGMSFLPGVFEQYTNWLGVPPPKPKELLPEVRPTKFNRVALHRKYGDKAWVTSVVFK